MEYLPKKLPLLLTVLGCLVALLYAAPAQAQATRTWVSGVGDDANPCSRTAPCKTFAGAISKTAAGGEINCLDSGGFGAVTITKAISIVCEGVIGSILSAGTNGINVNAGPSDRVTLRGIEISGAGTGLIGINFIAGQSLLVDNVNIYGITQNGINITSATNSSLTVKNSVFSDIGGAGIRFGGGGGIVALAIDHMTISRVGANGVELAAPSVGTVSNSLIFGSGGGAAATAGGAVLNMDNTVLENNGTGANAAAPGATIALDNVSLYANNAAVHTVVGANYISAGNNKFSGNASDGPPPSANMTIH
jgi:hypothetical protein